jgi:DNA-binding response OmpR family regulator
MAVDTTGLTATEARLLRWLHREPGRWVQADELIRRVWGQASLDLAVFQSSRHLLRVNVSRMRRKGVVIESNHEGAYREVDHA